MTKAADIAYQNIKKAIDNETVDLSREDYRHVLDEVESECEIRKMALDDDEQSDD